MGLKGDIVFCHDMLFHILDEDVYLGIINNLLEYSNKYIFIFTWSKNPLKKWYNNKTQDSYQEQEVPEQS